MGRRLLCFAAGAYSRSASILLTSHQGAWSSRRCWCWDSRDAGGSEKEECNDGQHRVHGMLDSLMGERDG